MLCSCTWIKFENHWSKPIFLQRKTVRYKASKWFVPVTQLSEDKATNSGAARVCTFLVRKQTHGKHCRVILRPSEARACGLGTAPTRVAQGFSPIALRGPGGERKEWSRMKLKFSGVKTGTAKIGRLLGCSGQQSHWWRTREGLSLVSLWRINFYTNKIFYESWNFKGFGHNPICLRNIINKNNLFLNQSVNSYFCKVSVVGRG